MNIEKLSPALVLVFWITLTGSASAAESGKRWYTEDQAKQGKLLFERHCEECHGKNGESSPTWDRPGPDGLYPPPPLNGTGHTWHHQLTLLRRIIREGGTETGGRMPGFEDKLSAEEIDALIAGFQSLWPENIYRKWSGDSHQRIPQLDFIKELLKELE